MTKYELDGKTYEVNRLQAGVIDELMASEKEKQGEKLIRKYASKVYDSDGTIEFEVETEETEVFQGTVTSMDTV